MSKDASILFFKYFTFTISIIKQYKKMLNTKIKYSLLIQRNIIKVIIKKLQHAFSSAVRVAAINHTEKLK